MTFQKGKLNTSNALVIGVLVAVLYFVMPRGSEKTSATTTDEPVAEANPVASVSTSAPERSNALPNKETKSSNPGDSTNGVSPEAANSRVQPLTEIDQEKLLEIVGKSPFCTTAAQSRSGNSTETEPPETAAVEPAPDQNARATALLRNSTVRLLYSSSTGRQAAVLNDEIVYRGSSVSDRLTVESIHTDGVRIRSSAPSPDQPD